MFVALFFPLYKFIVLLNTAYSFTVPPLVVVKSVTLALFANSTVVPVCVLLHPANVQPLGAVPAYAVKLLAVPYTCDELLIPEIFVLPAVVLLFPCQYSTVYGFPVHCAVAVAPNVLALYATHAV